MESFPTQRVLVVEDEVIVSMLIEDMLADLGHVVAGVAGKIEDALAAARDLSLDLAILDVNLHGRRTDDVAATLRDRGVPVIFATGYGAGGLDPQWREATVLQKPFQIEALADAINTALSR